MYRPPVISKLLKQFFPPKVTDNENSKSTIALTHIFFSLIVSDVSGPMVAFYIGYEKYMRLYMRSSRIQFWNTQVGWNEVNASNFVAGRIDPIFQQTVLQYFSTQKNYAL